jgi:vanillate O-demethylase monooxygenase subunit
MRDFLSDVWYVAGWSDEVARDRPLARTIANTPVVMFRDNRGELAALRDRCPHRFSPLSKGRIANGVIECGYHGLQFDRKGACVANPHGSISKALAVESFTMAERDGLLWLWLGDSAKARMESIPDMSAVQQEPPNSHFRGHLSVRAHHLLLVDNILDLSHADYLHKAALGSGGTMTRTRPRIEEGEDFILAEWFAAKEGKGVAIMRAELADPNALIDMWTSVRWHTSGAVLLKVGITPTGEPRDQGIVTHVIHAMTPQTPGSSHYFYRVWRNYQSDNAEYSRMMEGAVRFAFEGEDKDMIEAQQINMGDGDFMSMKPALLAIDSASMRARRLFDRALAAEDMARMEIARSGPMSA